MFIVWGAYWGVLLVVYESLKPFLKRVRFQKHFILMNAWLLVRVAFFFHLICFGWLFFRAQSVKQIIQMVQAILFQFGSFPGFKADFTHLALFVLPVILVEYFQYVKNDVMAVFKLSNIFQPAWSLDIACSIFLKIVFYTVGFCLIAVYGAYDVKEFMYAKF